MRAPSIVLLLLLVPLAGCLEGDAPDDSGGDPVTDPVRSLERGAHSQAPGYATFIARDEARYREVWAELHGPCEDADCPAPPEVDFAEERVVALVLGQRSSGCHAVSIVGARTYPSNDTTVLRAVEHTPPPGTACAGVITNPFHVVAIPRRDTRVEFDLQQTTGPPPPGASEPAPPPAGLRMREIERGASSGVSEALYVAVASEAEWRALWERHVSNRLPAPEPPEVDFREERVLAAFMGERRTGGYAVQIHSVRVEGGELVACVLLHEPPPDGATTDALTQPHHVVAVSGADEPVRFDARRATAGCPEG